VEDDVRPVLDGTKEHRRGRGVVDDEGNAGLLRDLPQLLEMDDVQPWVAQRLRIKCTGPRTDGAADRVRVRRLDEPRLDAESREGDLEEVVGPSVEAGGAHQLVAGAEEGEERERLRGLARGHGEPGDAALERRDALLEHVVGGVHDPRVDVPELLEGEEPGGVVGVAEAVAGGLIDGDRPRSGGGIGAVAGVQRQGLGTVVGFRLLAHGRCSLFELCCLGTSGPFGPGRPGGHSTAEEGSVSESSCCGLRDVLRPRARRPPSPVGPGRRALCV